MKLRQITLALAIAGMASAAHSASLVKIDPDGPGPAPAMNNVFSLDWAPGNTLAVPVHPLTRAADVTVGSVLQTYSHARLRGFGDNFNVTIPAPGLDSAYEWTFVAAFQEQFGFFSTSTPHFRVVPGGTNFFEIWVSPPNSSDLTGRGFSDGVRILAGTVLPFSGGVGMSTFMPIIPAAPHIPNLDAFGTNNYPGVRSIRGSGGGSFVLSVTFSHPQYFLTPPTIVSANFDTMLNLPFNQANPSSCFWNGGGYISGVGPIAGGHPDQCPINTVGPINGMPTSSGGTGPNNILFQDSSMSFVTMAVPEPATLALVGLGLVGLGFSLRRRSA